MSVRVCKARTCLNTFMVGEGSGGRERKTCSDKCRQRASRDGGIVSRHEKLQEFHAHVVELAERRNQLNDDLRAIADELDYMYQAESVARSEAWNEAQTLVEKLSI